MISPHVSIIYVIVEIRKCININLSLDIMLIMPRRNRPYFTDDILKCISLNQDVD